MDQYSQNRQALRRSSVKAEPRRRVLRSPSKRALSQRRSAETLSSIERMPDRAAGDRRDRRLCRPLAVELGRHARRVDARIGERNRSAQRKRVGEGLRHIALETQRVNIAGVLALAQGAAA